MRYSLISSQLQNTVGRGGAVVRSLFLGLDGGTFVLEGKIEVTGGAVDGEIRDLARQKNDREPRIVFKQRFDIEIKL